jgi:chlorobactene glucosyltransferase
MFFRRGAYEAIGGYGAARDNVNDDVLLGRLTLENGYKWCLADGTRQVSCRMYHNLNETMDGFSKNVFGFFNYRILPYFFAWLTVAYFFLKPVTILIKRLAGFESSSTISRLALAVVLGSMLLFFMAYKQLRIPLYLVLLYPVTIFMFVLVAYRSLFMTLTGHTSWKGRELKSNAVRWI